MDNTQAAYISHETPVLDNTYHFLTTSKALISLDFAHSPEFFQGPPTAQWPNPHMQQPSQSAEDIQRHTDQVLIGTYRNKLDEVVHGGCVHNLRNHAVSPTAVE